MEPVIFFSDEITIQPHTARFRINIGRPITVREFSRGRPVALYRLASGELLLRATGDNHLDFIQGPEV